MESFESWLDPDDNFDPENDPTPEREEADEATIAKLLGIGPRHVRRLTRAGVLRKQANGNFHRMDSIDAFIAHATKPPVQTAGMRDRQAELIQRRLDREAGELISMSEALTTMSAIAGDFVGSIVEVGELACHGNDEPERTRRREIAVLVAGQLEAKMAVEIEELRTGKQAEDE